MNEDGPSRTTHRKLKSNQNFIEGLATEWKLLWESITESNSQHEAPGEGILEGNLESLGIQQIKALTKALSSDRKKLNQRLERLNKEIDLYSAKLESLKLTSESSANTMDMEAIMKTLNELSDLGQAMSLQLQRIDQRLKAAHEREDEIRSGVHL
ncbi:MAG: Atg14 domain-containing protein [Proteobacteria bacterium]|jgi:uncharacterized phage infection (PIP) family protein YhgE|nr:Atg14 domain-containing protein [Pseudomonadota bacterium]